MRVPVPHKLSKEEVRERLRSRSHEIADRLPGGAKVDTQWPSDDRMNMAIALIGQQLHGAIEIGESEVVIELDLPAALSFLEPVIGGAVKDQGQKLLSGPE